MINKPSCWSSVVGPDQKWSAPVRYRKPRAINIVGDTSYGVCISGSSAASAGSVGLCDSGTTGQDALTCNNGANNNRACEAGNSARTYDICGEGAYASGSCAPTGTSVSGVGPCQTGGIP